MATDLNAIPKEAREELLAVGRQYGSRDTLAQAELTLTAITKYASVAALLSHGFTTADGEQLGEMRGLLQQAGVDREQARASKKETNQQYVSALATGKTRRQQARSVLGGVSAALRMAGNGDAVAKVNAALAQTVASGESAEALANQLDQLRGVLEDAAIAPAAADRGGPAVVADLGASATALRAASQSRTRVPGTPAETERLDLIDGLIVQLCRRARAAARSAARATGNPALAADFQLSKLYRSRSVAATPAAPVPVPTPA